MSQLIYQLRRKLPDLPLSVTAKTVESHCITSDVDEFRRLAKQGDWIRALAIYRQPFLADVSIQSIAFESWRSAVDAGISSLFEGCITAALPVASTDEEVSVVADAAERMIRWGSAPPSVYQIRVTSLLRLNEANRAAVEHSQYLESHDAGVLLPFDELQELLTHERRAAASDNNRVRFVGRRDELTRLQTSWSSAASGSGQVILITGEPGIGKSRLAEQFLRRAAISGARVLTAKCHAAARRSPYSGIISLVRENNVCADASLNPQVRSILHRLVQPFEVSDASHIESPEQWHHLILSALDHLLTEMASRRPLALFFDDIQWADECTARALTLWSLHAGSHKVALLTTVRTEDVEPTPDWIRHELAAGVTIPLGQLSIEDAAELAAAMEERMELALSNDQRNQVLWRSAGRPLLLIESLKALVDSGSPAHLPTSQVHLSEPAEQVLRRRFEGLTQDAAWTMGIASAYGAAVRATDLVAISGLPDDAASAALEALRSKGVLHYQEGLLAFPHELLREAAYRHTSPMSRALVHKRIAHHLRQADGDLGTIAEHYYSAGERNEAAGFALSAARLAHEGRLFSDSVHYYRLAARCGDGTAQQSAAKELARYLAQVGRLAEADELVPVLRACEGSSEAALLLDLIEIEATLARGSAADALQQATSILDKVADLRSSDLGVVLGLLLDIAHDVGNGSFAAELLHRCGQFRLADASSFDAEAAILSVAWEGATVDYKHASQRLDQINSDLLASMPVATQTLAWCTRGTLQLLAGDLQESIGTLAFAAKYAQEVGDLRRLTAATMNMAVALIEIGEFQRARHDLESLLSTHNRTHKLRAYTNLAILHYEAGNDALALSAVQTVLSANVSYASAKYDTTAPSIAGLVALRLGDVRTARLHYEQLTSDCTIDHLLQGDVGYTVSFVARMLCISGDQHGALALVDHALALLLPRDAIGSLRLQTLRAELLVHVSSDQAFALARASLDKARAIGANVIASAAGQLVDELRLKLT